MSNIVIQVENISKMYRLGVIGYGSLQDDLRSAWARFRGKEDPNTKIGEKSRLGTHGEFWALKDVGFKVEQGEKLGILGKNGAGKSTLLKLLSRVTSPTKGTIKTKGRIVSLLEVGTGFHPELTGRENVFLNGAILGMKRREIQSKFDEIVDFSGISQFVDTPVKRYSSGMYVRLAFSVAAHLDSEILILDEVLAVGDAEFQKKCLKKLNAVSEGSGKTILFVSHNLPTVLKFCNTGILMQSGSVVEQGPIADVVKKYRFENHSNSEERLVWTNRKEETGFSKMARIDQCKVLSSSGEEVVSTLLPGERYYLAVNMTVNEYQQNLSLFVSLLLEGELIFTVDCYQQEGISEEIKKIGQKRVLVELPTEILLNKEYEVEASLVFHELGWSLLPSSGQGLRFLNLTGNGHPLRYEQNNHPLTGGTDPSLVRPILNWKVEDSRVTVEFPGEARGPSE